MILILKKEKRKEKKQKKIKNNDTNELVYNFENEFENFKDEIAKNTLFIYEINNKIKPCLSENFLNSISIL